MIKKRYSEKEKREIIFLANQWVTVSEIARITGRTDVAIRIFLSKQKFHYRKKYLRIEDKILKEIFDLRLKGVSYEEIIRKYKLDCKIITLYCTLFRVISTKWGRSER